MLTINGQSGAGIAKVKEGMQQNTEPTFCSSGNWKDGERIANFGSTLSNVGLLVLASSAWTGVGAGVGGGMVAIGGALTYVGAERQARAGDSAAIVRGFGDFAAGRTFKALARSPLGEGLMGLTKDKIMKNAGPC